MAAPVDRGQQLREYYAKEHQLRVAVSYKQTEVIDAALARAKESQGKNLPLFNVMRIARLLCKSAFLKFQTDLLAQFPDKEDSERVRRKFHTKEPLLLCWLNDAILETILPEGDPFLSKSKQRSIEVIPPEST